MQFEVGKTYIVYSFFKETSRCRRNSLLKDNADIGKLKYMFEYGFSSGIGKTTDPILTENEAEYFNYDLLTQRKAFDFHQKKVAFVSGSPFIDKQQYFKNWGGNDVANYLIILSEEEKQKTNGYNAIIVSWRKRAISNSFRKKLLKD